MNGKKLTILLLLLGAFLLFLTVLFYLLKFGSANFSDNANDWVNFSNYFSGILNPIFTLLNLVFFAYLSFKLIKIEDERNNWTLQELARPYGNLLFVNTYDSIEISIDNVGLGPLVLTDFRVYKDINKPYIDFYDLVNDIADEENVNEEILLKIDSFTLNADSGAIAKDKSFSIFKLYFNDDNHQENRKLIELMRKRLNEYSISFTYKDMYGKEIECMTEKMHFKA